MAKQRKNSIIHRPMTSDELIVHFKNMYSNGIGYVANGIVSRCQSPIEVIAGLSLFTLLEDYGSKNLEINNQKEIGKYRVDYEVVYKPFHQPEAAPLVKIVIECDGHEFHEKTKEQASRDKERDRELQKMGYAVLRYSGSDLYNNWRLVRDDVYDIIDPNEKLEVEKALKEMGY